MPYYRGDYYRGDYYRGDLKSFFKKTVGVIGGAVGGFLTGGPLGAAKSVATAILGGNNRPVMATPTTVATQSSVLGTAVRVGARVLPPILAGKEILDVGRGFFGGRGGNGRRRTMNHLNPKALTRATRRVEGFVKKARKAVSPLGYSVVRRGSARCAPRRRCK